MSWRGVLCETPHNQLETTDGLRFQGQSCIFKFRDRGVRTIMRSRPRGAATFHTAMDFVTQDPSYPVAMWIRSLSIRIEARRFGGLVPSFRIDWSKESARRDGCRCVRIRRMAHEASSIARVNKPPTCVVGPHRIGNAKLPHGFDFMYHDYWHSPATLR